MKITSADRAKPFSVECDHDPDAVNARVDERFASHDEAADFCEKATGRFPCIWLSELGVYQLDSGKVEEGWVYFWWSDKTGWGERFGRREGYPASHLHVIRKYLPIAEFEKKLT